MKIKLTFFCGELVSMLSLILINSRNPPILIIKIRQIRYKTGLIKQTPWKIWLPLIF